MFLPLGAGMHSASSTLTMIPACCHIERAGAL
jgi:hypothetical protein